MLRHWSARSLGATLCSLAGLALLLQRVEAQESAPQSHASDYADALSAGPQHAGGTHLDGSEFAPGRKWSASKEVTIGPQGATTSAPGGAHLTIPIIAGQIRVQADVFPQGSSYIGLAVGERNLSLNFWQNLSLMLTIAPNGRYEIFGAGKELLGNPDKTLLKPGAVNHVEMWVDTTARTVSVIINNIKAVDSHPLPAAVQLDELTAAGFRFQDPLKTGQPYVRNFRVELRSTSVAGLDPEQLGMFFVPPGKPSTLRWRAASPGPPKPIPYVVSDYRGTELGKGMASLDNEGRVSLSRDFPRGFCEITFPEAHQSFGVMSIEPHVGVPDPYFGMDAALSWLEMNDARRGGFVEIMTRSGIAMARERFASVFKEQPGTYDWETSKRLGSLRKVYGDRGLKVLEILGLNTKQFEIVKGQAFPQNLPLMASEWVGVAQHWNAAWGGAEIFNEPDLKTASAEQYAPMVKAFSYTLAQAQSTAPLVAGAVATIPPSPYFDTLAANGTLQDADVFSFHSYDKPVDIEQMVVRYRDWLRQAGSEAMPLWQTECGKSWAKGPPRPPVAEDLLSAVEIAAMGVESKACGVARYFPFVLTYYEEGFKNFGMMGRDGTPLRSMGAYAQSISALGGRGYVGDLTMKDATVKLARVFRKVNEKEAVVTLYTGTSAAAVAFPIPVEKVEGVDGRLLAATGGKVPVPDGLTYVWVKAADLGNHLNTATRAAELTKIGQTPWEKKRLAAPLVLQHLAQDLPAQGSARRYLLTQEVARELPLKVRLHNLSPEPLQVTPALALPGAEAVASEQVTVPASSYADVSWKVNAREALDLVETRLLTVTAKTSGDVQPTPLAIPITVEGSLQQHLARHKRKRTLPITEAMFWKTNMGPGKSEFSKTGEGAWKLAFNFEGASGGWAFPRFKLTKRIDPATENGFLIRARAANRGRPAIIAKVATDGTGIPFWVPEIIPADGEWHTAYIPFADFTPGPGSTGNQNTRLDPAAWQLLEVGMTSNTKENALELSHLIVVGD